MSNHTPTTIDFSAQFGGQDAADAVLPHFKALKAAAKGIEFSGFPYPEPAYILRVDGQVSQFGFSGTGEPDVDRDGEYLSIDIGVTIQDRDNIEQTIVSGIMNSPEIITAAIRYRKIDWFDKRCLIEPLTQLCKAYRTII